MDHKFDNFLQQLLEEDIPKGDITTDHLLEHEQAEAVLVSEDDGVISGLSLVIRLYQLLDDTIYIKVINPDGYSVEKGDIIAIFSGNIQSILRGKDIALSIIQHMSNIASIVHQYKTVVNNEDCKLLDTRKTTPLLRAIEKQAVIDGGGINHRMNLSDQVLITKDHLQFSTSIVDAVKTIKNSIDHNYIIEVEVQSYDEFIDATNSMCDMVLLAHMSLDEIKRCFEINTSSKLIEVRVTCGAEFVQQISLLGATFISVEEFTTNVRPFPIKMKINI